MFTKCWGMGVAKGETLICRISVLLKEHVGVLPSSWDWPPLSFLFHPCLTATPRNQSSAPGDQAGPGTQTHSSTQPQSMPRSMLMFEIRIHGVRCTRRRCPRPRGDSRSCGLFPSKVKVVFSDTVVGFRTANQRGVLIPQTVPGGNHFKPDMFLL